MEHPSGFFIIILFKVRQQLRLLALGPFFQGHCGFRYVYTVRLLLPRCKCVRLF